MQTKPTSEFQSLDNKSARMSKRWKVLLLLFAALILSAFNASAVLPSQQYQWPLMPVFPTDRNVERAAERLAEGNELSIRRTAKSSCQMPA